MGGRIGSSAIVGGGVATGRAFGEGVDQEIILCLIAEIGERNQRNQARRFQAVDQAGKAVAARMEIVDHQVI